MIVFFILSFGLLLIFSVCLYRAFFYNKPDDEADRQSINIAIAKERLETIKDTDAEAAYEIKSQLVEEAQIEYAKDKQASSNTIKLSYWLVILLLPFFIIVSYLQFGDSRFLNPEQLKAKAPVSNSEHGQDIEGMLQRLEQRIAQDPNNIDTRILATQTYLTLEMYDKAIAGFEYLEQSGVDLSAEQYASWASAIANHNRQYTADAQKKLQQAIEKDPNFVTALIWLVQAEYSIGNTQQAQEYLNRLSSLAQTDPELAPVVTALANDLSLQIAATPAPPSAEPTPTTTPSINVNLAIDPRYADLSANVAAQGRIFIIVRVPGQRPPLAVRAIAGDDLPRSFALSDNDTMLPGQSIFTHNEVAVSAKWSPSGNATANEADGLTTQQILIDPNADNRIELLLKPKQ